MNSLLKVSNIYKNYSGVQALTDVSFEIHSGERVSLVGENGSGKSTIIKIISGVEQPTKGYITINNITTNYMTPKESIKAGVQVIYQDFSLYPNLTVEENLAYNYFLSKNSLFISYKKMRSIAKNALTRIKVNIPLQKLASELTIAERQMVSIAKVLLEDAKIIIMDEATTALTQKEVANLLEVIGELKQQGIALLFVSHKLDEIKAVSDRCVFLRNGEIVAEKSTADLSQKDIAYYMSGLEIEDSKPEQKVSDKIILEYKNIYTKNLKDISFSIDEGEIVGFAGLLGSGRSELALSVFGEKQILSGDFLMEGKKVQINSIADAMKLGIGYIPEDRLREALFVDKSIGINMVSAKFNEITNKFGFIHKSKIQDLVVNWTNNLKIKTEEPLRAVSTLSGGNQQRVILARWMMRDLKLMVLNRPTVGVDVSAKQEINKIITNLARKGVSFVLISDDLTEFLNLCHKVYIVKQGRIVDCITSNFITLDIIKKELEKEYL